MEREPGKGPSMFVRVAFRRRASGTKPSRSEPIRTEPSVILASVRSRRVWCKKARSHLRGFGASGAVWPPAREYFPMPPPPACSPRVRFRCQGPFRVERTRRERVKCPRFMLDFRRLGSKTKQLAWPSANEPTDQRTNGPTNERTSERLHERTNEFSASEMGLRSLGSRQPYYSG